MESLLETIIKSYKSDAYPTSYLTVFLLMLILSKREASSHPHIFLLSLMLQDSFTTDTVFLLFLILMLT